MVTESDISEGTPQEESQGTHTQAKSPHPASRRVYLYSITLVGKRKERKGDENGPREEVSPAPAPHNYAARLATGFTPVRHKRSLPLNSAVGRILAGLDR